MTIKILAISHLFPNSRAREYGVFVLNRLLAVNRQCQVKVIAPLQWFPFMGALGRGFGGKLASRETWEGLDVLRPRFAVIPRYFKVLDALSLMVSVLLVSVRLRKRERFDFDLVDVHWTYPDLLAGYVLAKWFKKKFIVTIRGREALYPGEVTLRRKLLEVLLRRADFVVTLSGELQDLVVGLGVPTDRVQVILNGVNCDRFQYQDQASCRLRLGLPQDGKILLSVGSLIERKGHHELIRILPELMRSHPVSLYIVGGVNPEGDYSPVLHRLIRELGLDNVKMVDKVNHAQLNDWYGAADLFCLATKGEGCPNVVLEALASGTPVVVTDVGAVRELVEPEQDGVIVEQERLTDLARIVDAALGKPWQRKAIADRMKSRTWEACAQQVVEVYRKVLCKGPHAGETGGETC